MSEDKFNDIFNECRNQMIKQERSLNDVAIGMDRLDKEMNNIKKELWDIPERTSKKVKEDLNNELKILDEKIKGLEKTKEISYLKWFAIVSLIITAISGWVMNFSKSSIPTIKKTGIIKVDKTKKISPVNIDKKKMEQKK